MSTPANFNWTADAVAELRRLHADRQWSFGDMARMLALQFGGHLTRCSCIGKARRIGLPDRGHSVPHKAGRGKGYSPGKAARQKQYDATRWRQTGAELRPRMLATERARAAPLLKPIVDQDIPLAQRRTLMQLENHHCRWPLWGDQPGLPREKQEFCGHPSADLANERPYCAPHQAIASTPARSAPYIPERKDAA